MLVHSHILPLGLPAPDFSLPDAFGRFWSLGDFAGQSVLAVVFLDGRCRHSLAAWSILSDLARDYRRQPVQFLAIDSLLKVEEEAEKRLLANLLKKEQIGFPCLLDRGARVAQLLKAQCLSESFVFKNFGNGDWQLFYHGRINDDLLHPDLVSEKSLAIAIDRVLNDFDPLENQRPAYGCAIKR